MSVLLYLGEHREQLQGQQWEASGYAISIAEFVRERAVDRNLAIDNPKDDPGLGRCLDKILADGRVKTVFAVNPQTHELLWSYPEGSLTAPPPDIPANLSSILIEDGVWISDVNRTGRRTANMEAYSSIIDKGGKMVAALGVVDDATAYVTESNKIVTEVAIAAIVIIVVGLIITIMVSFLISREVRSLSQTAALISGGNLDVQASPGHIQEIGDLGNTFNTMSDVLKDVLSRTKRSLIEGEQFRTHAELAASYAGMFRPSISEDVGGMRVAITAAGQDFGLFWTAFETDGTVCIALGHLKGDDDVDTVIAASAATRYLKHRLSRQEAGATIGEIVDLFKPDFFECYCITAGTVDHWTLAPVDDGTPSTSNALRPAVQSYPAGSRTLWTIHRFSPNSDALVEQYVRVFGHHGPDDLVHDIVAALPTGTEGALLVAGAAKPVAPLVA